MRVLIVDDEPSIRRTTRVAVESAGHLAAEAQSGARAVKAADSEGFDAVFLDVKLGSEDGLDVLDRLGRLDPPPAVILFTAYANIATAVEAMRRGAFDFIPKPFTPEQIRNVLDKVAKSRAMERRIQALESDLASGVQPIDMHSDEPAMKRALGVAFKAAETEANILILGPSGTGKSVLAREIHRRSGRRDGPFVTVNCPSLSRELLESELFGHAKGSFTRAIAETSGKVAAADGGTLFLDEIGEMPMEIQPKLLRLLQEREYERVGETAGRTADVRVIAASNRDLAAEVRAGSFREDLYYRLNVIAVTLPGLRERPADLGALAEGSRSFFGARSGKPDVALSQAVMEAFAQYPWPGNLREMRNIVERAVILSQGGTIELADLPEEFREPQRASTAVGGRVTLDALEAEHIRRVLAISRNLDEAARILGIDPATLYRKRSKLGLL
ncbi:MAG TPA: sigma-54 dependent transcriptional regulator [Opitutaceae bacterium]